MSQIDTAANACLPRSLTAVGVHYISLSNRAHNSFRQQVCKLICLLAHDSRCLQSRYQRRPLVRLEQGMGKLSSRAEQLSGQLCESTLTTIGEEQCYEICCEKVFPP
jgi:hypothetical protein